MAARKVTAALMKSQILIFIENHGQVAFNTKRKEPFNQSTMHRLVSVPEGTRLHTVTMYQASKEWRSINLLIHIMAQTGLRLADALKLNRNSASYHFRNKNLPTLLPEMLAMLGPTDYAQLSPGATKSDPLGKHFANFPSYLPYKKRVDVCAARALAHFEANFPVPVAQRKRTPLFADSDGVRLSRPKLEKVLDALLRLDGMNCDPAVHSWHSFRITLACQLKAAGADAHMIKSMCRWVSDESLRRYARDNRQEYARLLDAAAHADVASVQLANVPDIDEDHIYAYLSQLQQTGVLNTM